ncbi:tripartite tricarboxylate transporter substrate-binding protein [Nonomuraea aridisoli]|nr:tripartite tricarboxylate transporter substrate-binding protein [Nonomuraea aridisoli]
MTRRLSRAAAALGALGLAAACGGADAAVPPAEFYAGETIEFVVPYEPGGGYDLYARDIAPYLAKCTKSKVRVLNEPGAGGLLATSQTAVAKPDGLRVEIVNTIGVVSAQVGRVEGLNFDLADFSWLARLSTEPNIVVVAADSRFKTFDDMLRSKEPVKFVSTGPGANDYINPPLLSKIYDFPAEVITGFSGSGEARTAILRGDADAQVMPLNTALSGIRAGLMRPVLVIGETDDKHMAGVASAAGITPRTPQQQAILRSLLDLTETSRTVAAPPHLDKGRLEYLRQAFKCALTDPGLVRSGAEQQRPVSYLSGEDTRNLVVKVLNADPAFQTVVRANS